MRPLETLPRLLLRQITGGHPRGQTLFHLMQPYLDLGDPCRPLRIGVTQGAHRPLVQFFAHRREFRN